MLLGIATFFEGFDQLLVAYSMPLFKVEWQLTPVELTMVVTTGSAGMLIGAMLTGVLADRFGRIRVVVAAMLVTALASLLLMVSPNIEVFAALRFVQGLGIGGEVPAAAVFVNELAKARARGRFVLLYELAFPAGLSSAALIASVVVPAFGWRALYLIGALPAVLALLVIREVPESPRWLASRGDTERAERAMRTIEDRVGAATGAPLPEPSPVIDAPGEREGTARVRDLFGGRYRRRTAILAVLWFAGFLVNYGLTTWLPTIYTSIYHLPIRTALNYTLVSSLSGFLGCVAVALLVDRIGRRASIAAGLAGAGLPLLALAALGAGQGASVVVWSTLATFFIYASTICLYLYTPELYPTRGRGTGISFHGAIGRVGMIVGPVLVGSLMSAGAPAAAVFALLGVLGVVAAGAALLGEETSGRTLEELND
ncbi:MFS transporter [Pseudonocardia eucalypti]|uniref:MFS transporter n=1 Tax=Pseudonocardia eucalypti TaxID=648755 RepID=A0ABP9RD47_9PSEU|nr:putative MFS transporter [Pseudonocardia eucalypti]